MQYRIQEGEFDLPDLLFDQTVNVFTITRSGRSAFNIVITRSTTEATLLDDHVENELAMMKQGIVGFAFLWKRRHQLGGRPATIAATRIAGSGEPVEQRHVFCLLDGSRTLTITASSGSRFDDQQMGWLNDFAASFKFSDR